MKRVLPSVESSTSLSRREPGQRKEQGPDAEKKREKEKKRNRAMYFFGSSLYAGPITSDVAKNSERVGKKKEKNLEKSQEEKRNRKGIHF